MYSCKSKTLNQRAIWQTSSWAGTFINTHWENRIWWITSVTVKWPAGSFGEVLGACLNLQENIPTWKYTLKKFICGIVDYSCKWLGYTSSDMQLKLHILIKTIQFFYSGVLWYHFIVTTVEPVFSGPRDERPPAMYGQCSNVPITFQRKYPWDERPPGGRGRGQRFFVMFHLLGRTVNFILINIFQ